MVCRYIRCSRWWNRTEEHEQRAHANWCRVRAQSTKSGRRNLSAWYFVKVFATINRDLGSSRGTAHFSPFMKNVYARIRRDFVHIFFALSSISLLSVETKSPPIRSCVLPRDCHRSDDRRLSKWDANCDMWMKENHWIKSVDVTATARMLEAINLCLSITHFQLLSTSTPGRANTPFSNILFRVVQSTATRCTTKFTKSDN